MRFFLPLVLAGSAAPVTAQLSLPGISLPQPRVLDPITGEAAEIGSDVQRLTNQLARDRLRRVDRLVRRNRDLIERDAFGDPARRGELLLMDADAATLRRAVEAGFRMIGEERIEGLGVQVWRMALPAGISLADGQKRLAALAPHASVSADVLHFSSGGGDDASMNALPFVAQAAVPAIASPVGVIDGAPGSAVPVSRIRGFAEGAPAPSDHGSAVVDLLRRGGAREILVADVYGTDKAGGNALAIARGLGWLVESGSKVVNMSLVGPRNAVLERAVEAAQARGVVIVAAVGNDGPAAPPAYPASYAGVLAVTGVDRKDHALIEAGHALHIDYAAPGADIHSVDARGKRSSLRGTSFAAPLVSARAAVAMAATDGWRRRLDSEARDLGPKGVDRTYGRGLLCGNCVER